MNEKENDKINRYVKLIEENNDAEAMFKLGVCYCSGNGVKQSYEEAVKWYKLASKYGSAQAQACLGDWYYNGRVVQQSYEEAFKLYKLSANQNYARAYKRLAQCYYFGDGVEQNPKEAFKYYMLAISNNYSICNIHLAYLYFYGKGVDQDFLKAKEYFEKAIEQGYDASFPLEVCNRELGIEDTNNYAREFINALNDSNYAMEITNKIDELFDSLPQTLESKSKVFIISGLISYYSFYKLQKEANIKLDYTSCITPLLKALENEIKKYFIDKYLRYLEDKVSISDFHNSYFLEKDKEGYYKYSEIEDRFNKFTLGEFKNLIGLKENISVYSIKYNQSYDDNRDDSRTTVIDSTMLDFLKEEVFDKDKFTWNIDAEIINYLVNLNDVITFITKELRNPAAHDLVMSLEKAETTINYLLFTKKLLIQFYEKMK